MNFNKAYLVIAVMVMVYAVESYSIKFTPSIEQSESRDCRPGEWTSKPISGLQIWIAAQGVSGSNTPIRYIYLFMKPENFNEEKLKIVFTSLAAEYDYPEYLSIKAFCDIELLWQEIRDFVCEMIPDIRDFQEKARTTKGKPHSNKIFWARYSRRDGGESFYYRPDPEKEDIVEVQLKEKPIHYTGDINSDFILAVREQDTFKVISLLVEGANINAKDDDGNTVLMLAVLSAYIDTTKILLAEGADVNAENEEGYTALINASGVKEIEIIRALLNKGAKVNKRNIHGQTALIIAAANGRIENVEALLESKADVNARDDEGQSALMEAAANGEAQVVQVLLDRKAEINARDNEGKTALMLAHNHSGMLLTLLNNGADVDVRDKHGWTALMYAAEQYHIDKVRLLLEKAALVNTRNNRGETALTIAKRNVNNERIIQLLKSAGANE